MQLEIHDQSMTMLTMQTKTQKTHPKGGCVEPKFTRARNPWPIHDYADDADQKRKNRTQKAGASNRVDTCGCGKIWIKLETNRIHDHRMDKLWENATNQRWHISQILVFPPEFWKLGKCRDRHFPIFPSSEKSLNNLPGIGNTRKMAISRFLVPIFKISSIVAWQISVTNGS